MKPFQAVLLPVLLVKIVFFEGLSFEKVLVQFTKVMTVSGIFFLPFT